MSERSEQSSRETASPEATGASGAPPGAAGDSAPKKKSAGRARARTRTPKQDAVLSEAVALAREAVVAGAQDGTGIGEHRGVLVHEDRLLTHLFDCTLPGYPGWTWYATVARAPRSKHVTVCESGLVSGPGSLLAPPWVPWEERVQEAAEQEGEQSPGPGQGEDSTDQHREKGPEERGEERTEDGASS